MTMPKHGHITDFWRRLTEARQSCNPPKSMNQIELGKEYDRAQSAVTKWKTGGAKGNSLPEPELIVQMAIDANVNVSWLWANQGDMRPLPITDPIVRRIVEAVQAIPDPDARLKVFEAAITQQTLQIPAVAAAHRDAQEAARRSVEPPAAARPRTRARR